MTVANLHQCGRCPGSHHEGQSNYHCHRKVWHSRKGRYQKPELQEPHGSQDHTTEARTTTLEAAIQEKKDEWSGLVEIGKKYANLSITGHTF